jgi:hypothetical protein
MACSFAEDPTNDGAASDLLACRAYRFSHRNPVGHARLPGEFSEKVEMNWGVVEIALVAGGALVLLLLLFLLLRPKQKIRLSQHGIRRPHMDGDGRAKGGVFNSTTIPPTAEKLDVAPEGIADDLTLLKGVGPKLAAMLAAHGLTRFDQIASLSEGQLSTLDESLGAFRGRLTRDRVVEQADYLSRGDRDGFEQRFGSL